LVFQSAPGFSPRLWRPPQGSVIRFETWLGPVESSLGVATVGQ
jgi:hypothetical protein